MSDEILLVVNGKRHTVQAAEDTPLLYASSEPSANPPPGSATGSRSKRTERLLPLVGK